MSTTLKNANLSESAQVDSGSVQPFTRSQKIYVQGSRPDIREPDETNGCTLKQHGC